MDLQRGTVYLIRLELPQQPTGSDPDRARAKYFVVLQSSDRAGNTRDVAGVLCNTKKPPERQARAFEVEVGIPEGFDHPTVIDCRFPFTFEQSVVTSGQYYTALSPRIMAEVDMALAHGLQII